MKQISKNILERIDDVLRFLGFHKEQATRRLFHDATEEYIKEWLERDVTRYWCLLDDYNRRRLVEMAREFYTI